ncbi:MAG TPA: UBP-type zinc finger domain-containing protein [Gammaproteobacteria bacterium]|nr:UBP-type zinc finger domain-containing protein [Gammaproteobacteria bacterium]
MPCEHLAITDIRLPQKFQCDECVKTGDSWVHLRTCQTCGGTHCCDSSINHHATRHAQVTGHPVVASAEPGERWLYCYIDRKMRTY